MMLAGRLDISLILSPSYLLVFGCTVRLFDEYLQVVL